VRTRAELALNPLAFSQLRVHCVSPLLVVEVVDSNNQIRTNSAPMDPDAQKWADQILALTHSLVADTGQDASVPRPVAPPSAATARNESPRPSALAVVPTAPPRRDSPDWYHAHTLSVAVGPCAEFWGSSTNLQLGPSATIGVPTLHQLRLALAGGSEWSLVQPSDIAMRHWHAGIEGQYGSTWWMAWGIQLSVLSLTPSKALLPKSQSAFEPMLTFRAGYTATIAGQRWLASAGLRSYPESREVRVDGQSVFTVPMLAITAALAYEFGI